MFFLGAEGCTLVNYPRIFEMDLWHIYIRHARIQKTFPWWIYTSEGVERVKYKAVFWHIKNCFSIYSILFAILLWVFIHKSDCYTQKYYFKYLVAIIMSQMWATIFHIPISKFSTHKHSMIFRYWSKWKMFNILGKYLCKELNLLQKKA